MDVPLVFDVHFERCDQDLLPVVAQDHVTGEIRMLAWASREAIEQTLATGQATFFSRSRNELWVKGATSGAVLDVASVLIDCDADAVIYQVTPRGPTCHTGAPSCFFRRLSMPKPTSASPADKLELELEVVNEPIGPSTLLRRLDDTLLRRREATGEKSYTKSLYEKGPLHIGEKIREEANELAVAVASEDEKRVVSEAADVLFHVMVALRSRNVGIEDVLRELERRTGTSGHDEKRARGSHTPK